MRSRPEQPTPKRRQGKAPDGATAVAPAPGDHVLRLQRQAGNSAVSALVVQRNLSGGDKVSMNRWGKDVAAQKKFLKDAGPEEAGRLIAQFCRERTRKKDPPTFKDVLDHLGLTQSDATVPVPKVAPVEGMTFDLRLINSDTVEIGFDHHHSKHQTTLLPGLKAYTGKGAADESRFNSRTYNIPWHTRNTAETMRRWVLALDAAGRLDPAGTKVQSSTGEDLEGEAIGYVATAMKDGAGKLYGSYHCYPLAGFKQ
jgi:hypothetical protein